MGSQEWDTAQQLHHHKGLSGEESACRCRRHKFDPGLGRCPGVGNGNPLQYSCLENFMGRGAWWAVVHGVIESDTTGYTCIPEKRERLLQENEKNPVHTCQDTRTTKSPDFPDRGPLGTKTSSEENQKLLGKPDKSVTLTYLAVQLST